jgi:hypothetical protein
VCGNWTVEGHLEGRPAHVVALFERFCQPVERCGPFEYVPVRHQIGFQLDDEFSGWIAESYAVGPGTHREPG